MISIRQRAAILTAARRRSPEMGRCAAFGFDGSRDTGRRCFGLLDLRHGRAMLRLAACRMCAAPTSTWSQSEPHRLSPATMEQRPSRHADQARRFTAIGQRPRRLVHRNGPDRPTVCRPRLRRGLPATPSRSSRAPALPGTPIPSGRPWSSPPARAGPTIWAVPSRTSGPATWSGSSRGEKHWHGAAPTTAMTHIAIQEALDGKSVEWMEHVTDDQYGA